MARRLRSDPQVWRLAVDLGLRPSANPVADIQSYCRKKLRAILREFSCRTLSDLLVAAGARLDTLFIELHTDLDVERVKQEYLAKGELAFADLEQQLGPDVYAITFHRRRRTSADRAFVSIIDCRGDKSWRAYFSKWHEIAHLLTLTDQARLRFCRTHVPGAEGDPEEALMEVIAGDGGFLPDLVQQHASGPISFEKVLGLRAALCPDASEQASLIGFVRAWPEPCLLLRAQLGLKKADQRASAQTAFDFRDPPRAALRAVQVTGNEAAARVGLAIPPNMRVPKESVICSVFNGEAGSGEQSEDLSWWTSSDGKRLAEHRVQVAVRRRGDHVQALIQPLA